MKWYSVMFCTDLNRATQFMTVEAENKAEAKAKVRTKLDMKVHFIDVIDM